MRLMEVLDKAGHGLVDFDLISPKTGNYEFIKGNLKNGEYFAPTYLDLWDVNCTGTFNVFEFAVKNKLEKVVYASSVCAIGIETWLTADHGIEYFPIDEGHPCKPQDLYGTCKLISEKLAYMYSKRSKTCFLGMRFANVWFDAPDGGPTKLTRNYIDVVKDLPRAYETIRKKGWCHGAVDAAWEYVGVYDVAEACKLALEKEDLKSGVFNIGAADTCSDWDSIKLAHYFYPGVPIRNPVDFIIDRKKALFDITKAQKELGYRPEFNWKEFVK